MKKIFSFTASIRSSTTLKFSSSTHQRATSGKTEVSYLILGGAFISMI